MTGARPTLVVLGGGPAQQHAIDAAHALGVRTVVCDSEPGLGDATVSSEDAAGVLRVAAEAGADGLIAPGTDWPVRVAAEVAAKLGLPHPLTPAVARAATDKIAQREAFMAAGVPQPDWSTEQPPGYPCVVKAADRQGQRAMTVVDSPDGLAVAVERARAGSRSGRAILERFAEGREVTVNGFCRAGHPPHRRPSPTASTSRPPTAWPAATSTRRPTRTAPRPPPPPRWRRWGSPRDRHTCRWSSPGTARK